MMAEPILSDNRGPHAWLTGESRSIAVSFLLWR